MVFQKGVESRHHKETPQERKAAIHVRRVQNKEAQVFRKTDRADLGRAPYHFPP